MEVIDNRWLASNNMAVNSLSVDKTKTDYYIHYYNAKKNVSNINQDWTNIKNMLDELKSGIQDINKAIDSEDYKAQTISIIRAIDDSTEALDENFKKLFSSVVRRMDESAESDEWFSETAKLYSSYILAAILGGELSSKPAFALNHNSILNPAASTSNELNASSVQYSAAPQPAQTLDESTDVDIFGNARSSDLSNGLETGASPEALAIEPQNDATIVETYDLTSNATQVAGEGRVIDIPDSVKQTGLCPNYTGYDYFYGKWTKGTTQRELSEQWGAAGKPSSNGIATLNDRYLVAVSPKFGKVGDNIDIVLNDGQVINATIADSKGSDATSEWGHVLTKSGAVDIIEWEASGSKSDINLGTWKNVGVDKIVNLSS